MRNEKKTDLMDEQIQAKLKKAKHDYQNKKEPIDAGKIFTVVVIAMIILGLVLSIVQSF